MKFSEQWLREWVNPSISTEALAEQITMAGLEVDGVDPVAGEFTGVVVGEVMECGQHPDADKLQVTKVNIGEDELVDIVCGAKNCRQGLKVAVAKVGAVLPGNFKIKKAKLRGQPSFGMLCSESELGLAEDSPGIMELPLNAEVGTDFHEFLGLDDKMIEVDLTPNRADCLGMKGLAREVGVLNQMDVTEPTWGAAPVSIDETFDVKLEAPEACPRYVGRVIRNIDANAKTPLWMVEKLRRSGIRSIDPVVDITNFVLVELGHPMHAFDLEKLEGGVRVRMAEQGEKLTLLDGNEVTLNADTLVIADHTKPLAIAGIFGGEQSGVQADSKHIFLESAWFNPVAIMGRARSYGLHTDASHRYERGVDPALQVIAMERATALLLEIVGGEAGPVVDTKSEEHLPTNRAITLRAERLHRLVGISFDTDAVTEMLQRMGLEVTVNAGSWDVSVPPYRFDLKIEEDLIEEVARIYGYNNIPNVSPVASLKMSSHREAAVATNNFKQLLVDRGYQEAITYSFVDPKMQNLFHPEQEGMVLPHPISVEMSVMRQSVWPGLVQAAVYNQKRQQPRVRLFEQGLKFIPDDQEFTGCRQVPVIGGLIAGLYEGENWDGSTRAVDFYDLKGDVEAILGLARVNAEGFEFIAEEHSALHPGQSAAIYLDGKRVGWLGTIHPEVQKKSGLNGKTYLFELELESISITHIPEVIDISKFPSNRRDLAIVVEDKIPAADVLSLVKKVGGNQLVDLKLFDVYHGEGVDPGYKSLAVALTLQDSTRTLEDKDIAETVNNVVSALHEEFNASLRE